MPSDKTTTKKRRGKGHFEAENEDSLKRVADEKLPDAGGLGKGASSPKPLSKDQLVLDFRVGIILALSLPLAVLFFWKVTLPVTWFVVRTVLGEKTVLKLFYLKEDVVSAFMSECPSWISAEERYFLADRLPDAPRRITSPKTPEEFEEIIRHGEPVIITDAMKGWESFGTWDCESFTKQYPEAEYFDWQADTKYKLKNITSRPGFDGMKCASGYIEASWPVNKKYAKEWLKKMSPLPAFLPHNAFADETPGVGFIGTQGTGVSPHLDETCDTFMTAQFSGVKNWSLSWPVKEEREIRWRKPIVFTLYPGDMLFWYVNMRHHTEVVHGCSLSFSFQLQTPLPKAYFTEQRTLVSDLPAEQRGALYAETHTSDVRFLDKCRIVVRGDQVFLH